MHGIKKWLTYGIFILLLSIFFIYFLFPSDSVKKYIAGKLSHMNTNLGVSIGHVHPTFPPGIRLRIVNFTYFGELIFDADNVIIIPRLISFFSRKRSLMFKADAHQGFLKGKIDVTGKNANPQVYLVANINGIQLENVPALKNQLPFNLTGILDAKITYENTRESGHTILARLEISDCEVKTSKPFLNLDRVNFRRIETDLSINNDTIEIIQGSLQGEQIQALVSGLGILKDPLKKSIIDLSGTIKLDQSFMIGLKTGSDKRVLGKSRSERQKISFKINGSFDNPSFLLK